MQEARIVGLGAAIIVNRKLVWTRGYGFADKERAVPFTKDTIMNIGSISKTITGAALMRAVQDGKLSLDEDVNKYLPFKVANPSFPNEPITLRQLATHTSSITDRGAVYAAAYHFGRDSPQSPRRIPARLLCIGREELLEGELPEFKAGDASRVLEHRGRAGGLHRRTSRR